MSVTKVTPSAAAVQAAIAASGLLATLAPDAHAPAERARRASTALVRHAHFAERVLRAYNGRCAMCGLGVGLVEAAHIYPVSAPESRDEPWNGLALCPNHHAAFDLHIVAVRPRTGEITFSPQFLDDAASDAPARAFIHQTLTRLARPAHTRSSPAAEMFERRYAYFADSYGWRDH